DKVFAEQKASAEKLLLKEMIAEERAKLIPQEELVEIVIDLPAYAEHLLIDGKYYYHGSKVPVTRAQAASIRENMARCWVHEKLSGNPGMREYKPVATQEFSANSVGSTNFARV